MAASFPTTVPTTAQLRGDLVDNLATALSAGITSAATTINVDDTTDWPSAGLLSLRAASGLGSVELCSYTGKTATSFTGVTRNSNSRYNSAWLEDDLVELLWAATMHNHHVEETIAIAQNISTRFGLGSTNVTITSGKVLANTTAARTIGAISAQVQIEGTTSATSSLSITRNTADTSAPFLMLAKSRGAAVGAVTIVQSGDGLGDIYFFGADGVDANSYGARISAFVDGTPGVGDIPGRLVFYTTLDGASSSTERMRITNAGLVGINTITPISTVGGLDVASGGLSLILGANNNAMTTRTDATIKAARMGLAHYTNAEEPAAVLSLASSSTDNEIDIGGGTNTLNAATLISFYTAANNTTVTGTERMRIGSSGNVGIAPTAKLYLDGVTLAGDTYIQEDSSNEILFFVGGSNAFLATTTTVRISASHDLIITAATKLYLDSGGDSYITEQSANVIGLIAGGTTPFVVGASYAAITATHRLYLDGGGNTYLVETSADVMNFFTNGAQRLSLTASGSIVPGTAALATNATDGFTYIQTCAGTPTGVPTTFTGRVAMVYDTTNNKFYIYNGSWKGGTTPGTFI